MKELSLFTGAGGGLLGTHLLGWTPVGYVEKDDYAQRIIAARIRDGILPNAPIFGDIRAFNREGYAASYQGMVDVITAGFPCQPFSVAGKRDGADDERNMWPATIDTIRMVRPEYALLENVSGLLSSGYFGRILGDLAESGYDCRWRILSAAELGAPHLRKRLWIVAHAQRHGRRAGRADYAEHDRGVSGSSNQHAGEVAHADSNQGHGRSSAQQMGRQRSACETAPDGNAGGTQWSTEPELGRMAYGVAHRVDRLRAIGNGQVPAVAATAWRLLKK